MNFGTLGNATPTVAYAPGGMAFGYEGVSSVSDDQGNLLLFTNGGKTS
ncbi:MAG: hypothetical protein ACO3EE_10215 [Flavobacteriales bacterium]